MWAGWHLHHLHHGHGQLVTSVDYQEHLVLAYLRVFQPKYLLSVRSDLVDHHLPAPLVPGIIYHLHYVTVSVHSS